MKKIAIMMITVCLLFSSVSFAAEGTPMTKLGKGLLNIMDAPFEIPGTMMRTAQTEGTLNGISKGFLMGTLNTGMRLLSGVYEVITFSLPIPEGYGSMMRDEPRFLSLDQ